MVSQHPWQSTTDSALRDQTGSPVAGESRERSLERRIAALESQFANLVARFGDCHEWAEKEEPS